MSALPVQVTEETFVPAAEWELCHWSCHPYVDSNIPSICPVPESPCIQSTGSEKAGHVPKIVLIYKVDGLVY